MMDAKKFSIIIPSHGRKEELVSCIKSIEKQKNKNCEILVVNGKPDCNINEIKQSFTKVNFIDSKADLGASSARNLGARLSKGEYLIFFDDDCEFIENDVIDKIQEYFSNNPKLGAVTFTMLDFSTGKEDKKLIPRWDRKSIDKDYYVSFFIAGGVAIKRDLFFDTGQFWELLDPYFGQDTEFGYRLIDKGHEILRSASINVKHKTSKIRFLGSRTLQRILYGTAHVPLMAIRDLPIISIISLTLLSWGYFFLLSILRLRPDLYLRGLKIALCSIPTACKARKCITPKAQLKIMRLYGRLFF